jgi:hypothetical protein
VDGFINFIKDYIYPHTNLGNGRHKGCRNEPRNGRRNGYIYKAQKLIDYRAGSYDYFKPICSPRPYVGSFNNFVEEGDCSTYKISRVASKSPAKVPQGEVEGEVKMREGR